MIYFHNKLDFSGHQLQRLRSFTSYLDILHSQEDEKEGIVKNDVIVLFLMHKNLGKISIYRGSQCYDKREGKNYSTKLHI